MQLNANVCLDEIPELIKLTANELINIYKFKRGDAGKFVRKIKLEEQQDEIKIDDNIITNISTKSNYNISTPYIILFGISSYYINNYPNLTATIKDINNLTLIFRNEYKYKYVFDNNDFLYFNNKKQSNQNITKQNIKLFLKYHSQQIQKINNNQNNKNKIDSVILYYTGNILLNISKFFLLVSSCFPFSACHF